MRSSSSEARQKILRRLEVRLAERPEIVFAYVHGSFTEDRPFHDIDVAVWVESERILGGEPLDYELDLGVELTRLLETPVDVRRLNEAPLGFRYHATRGILLLSRDEEKRSALLEQTQHAYWDYQPVARAYLTEVLRG